MIWYPDNKIIIILSTFVVNKFVFIGRYIFRFVLRSLPYLVCDMATEATEEFGAPPSVRPELLRSGIAY